MTRWASRVNPCTPNITRNHHDDRIRRAEDPSRLVHIYAAREEARRRGDRRVGTEHLLLALLEDPAIEAVLGVTCSGPPSP